MNRLELEVVPRPVAWGPDLRVLVDGVESLKGTDDGFGADEILRSGALLPVDPPRRVALYTCSCGGTGCANVTVVVSRDGECVRWSTFMSITGEYDTVLPPQDDPDPQVDDEDDSALRHPLDLPDLVFDKTQYLSEVEAALRELDAQDASPSPQPGPRRALVSGGRRSRLRR